MRRPMLGHGVVKEQRVWLGPHCGNGGGGPAELPRALKAKPVCLTGFYPSCKTEGIVGNHTKSRGRGKWREVGRGREEGGKKKLKPKTRRLGGLLG